MTYPMTDGSPAQAEPNLLDPTALMHAKMAKKRRQREESKGIAPATPALFSQGESSSNPLAKDSQSRKDHNITQDELAALRAKVQVMEKKQEESSKLTADNFEEVVKLREEVLRLGKELLRLREELLKQSGKVANASQENPEQQTNNEDRRTVTDSTDADKFEKAESAKGRDQTSILDTIRVASPPLLNKPAPSPASSSSSPLNLATPCPTTPASASPSPSTPIQFERQCQVFHIPKKNQGRVGQTKKRTQRWSLPGITKRKARSSGRKNAALEPNEQRKGLWLESERDLVIDVVREERQRSETYPSYDIIAKAYNDRLRGVIQRAGEVIIGGAILTMDRNAPVRTGSAVSMIMSKCGLLACQQHKTSQGVEDKQNLGGTGGEGSVMNQLMVDDDDAIWT